MAQKKRKIEANVEQNEEQDEDRPQIRVELHALCIELGAQTVHAMTKI